MNLVRIPPVDNEHYQIAEQILHKLRTDNLLAFGSGFCWAMADITANLLREQGVACYLQEVELTIVDTDPPTFHVVGLQSSQAVSSPINGMATHVVVVTKQQQPMLLDTSIASMLPGNFDCILGAVAHGTDHLAQYMRGTLQLTYRPKLTHRYGALYQESIVDRIKTDQELRRSSRINRWLMAGIVLVFMGTSFATIMSYDNIARSKERAGRNQDRIVELQNKYEQLLIDIQQLKDRSGIK
jgi:hypothetical protein